MIIEVKGFFRQFWLGGKLAPGKDEGQEDINGNISRSPATEKGLLSYPAG
jgi:hypothetical protein